MKKYNCYFDQHNVKHADYKDVELLNNFLTPSGRIQHRRHNRVSAKRQRELSLAIKRARFMGLIPFVRS